MKQITREQYDEAPFSHAGRTVLGKVKYSRVRTKSGDHRGLTYQICFAPKPQVLFAISEDTERGRYFFVLSKGLDRRVIDGFIERLGHWESLTLLRLDEVIRNDFRSASAAAGRIVGGSAEPSRVRLPRRAGSAGIAE